MATSAVFLGDFTEARTRPIGSIPREAESGEIVRALWIFTDPLKGDPANYWTLVIGRYSSGSFKAERDLPFPQGFPGGPVRVDLTPEIRLSRGDLLAMNVRPSGGDTSPLTGLSVLPEYAHSGARARQ